MSDFKLTSNSFNEGDSLAMDHILAEEYGFGCAGGNQSPHLAWTDPPDGTESFALTMYDPDAPTGSGFWHWVVINIQKDIRELSLDASQNGLPAGAIETRNDFPAPGYGGPCPPEGHGPHRYIFSLHAVNTDELPVTPDLSAAIIGFNLHFMTIEKAVLTGKFEK